MLKDISENGNYQKHLENIVKTLCQPQSYKKVYHRINHDVPMPSIQQLEEIVEECKMVLFPGYFGNSEITPQNMQYYIGSAIDGIARKLTEQIKRGYCFSCSEGETIDCIECEHRSRKIMFQFMDMLPEIRRMLAMDVQAAYEGDPAAKSHGETIFCYPSITAMIHYRIAHALYILDVPLIPRIITEMAHSHTGIDIHPGATISENFFIDHGTGVVIGETTIIGKNVRIYQGVTLGAKSFPLDENGNPMKGIPRHPIVEDDVIIYSGATILGRVTIGRGSVIGGNVWLTESVPPQTNVVQHKPSEMMFEHGGGI